MFDYIRDPAEIYRKSFAIVREEAELSGLSAEEADLAVRLIHSCGMPEIAGGLEFSQGAVAAGKAALQSGATILADVEMVRHGIIRARLPAENPVRCTLHNDGVREAASNNSTTRSAAVSGVIRSVEGNARILCEALIGEIVRRAGFTNP